MNLLVARSLKSYASPAEIGCILVYPSRPITYIDIVPLVRRTQVSLP